jgi:hypothetical protein
MEKLMVISKDYDLLSVLPETEMVMERVKLRLMAIKMVRRWLIQTEISKQKDLQIPKD